MALTRRSGRGQLQQSRCGEGFKLYNGKYVVIKYPNAVATTPQAINDNGVVVGSYSDGTVRHGFTWQSGTYNTIDYPNARFGTVLTDANNSGVIVGNHLAADWALDSSTRMASSPTSSTRREKRGHWRNQQQRIDLRSDFLHADEFAGFTAVCK